MTPSDRDPLPDLLLEADHAEQVGDQSAAASKLRTCLELNAGDDVVRLRLGRLLVALSESASARQILTPLDRYEDHQVDAEANRLLAALDESEGALTSAQIRWERALADDIDDPEAHARLRALRQP